MGAVSIGDHREEATRKSSWSINWQYLCPSFFCLKSIHQMRKLRNQVVSLTSFKRSSKSLCKKSFENLDWEIIKTKLTQLMLLKTAHLIGSEFWIPAFGCHRQV